jgi:hypothetical protein
VTILFKLLSQLGFSLSFSLLHKGKDLFTALGRKTRRKREREDSGREGGEFPRNFLSFLHCIHKAVEPKEVKSFSQDHTAIQ